MSISLRLSLIGKKNHPIYKIVVSETRYKRNGKYLAELGIYNPNAKPPVLNIKKDEFDKWVKNGAIISEGLSKALKTK